MILVEIFAALYVTLAAAAITSLLWSAISGIPYVPSDTRSVENVFRQLDLPPSTRLIDLGSGDGRIVIMAASRLGWSATGIEINPLLTVVSKIRSHLTKTHNVSFTTANFLDLDLSGYDIIYIFGFPAMMRRIYPKLVQECHPGTWIVSNSFTFPGIKPVASHGDLQIYRINRKKTP